MAESNQENLINSNILDEDFSDAEHKSYKLYNFRRPDKFSKDNLRALRDIHREFSKAISLVLSGYLRMRVEIEIVSVDQLTYEEFVRSMPSPISVGVFEFEPLAGQILLGISFEVISCIVNRMLGGVGNIDSQSRELTDIEKALAKKVINIIIKSLEDSWNTIIPVTGKFISIDDNYQSIQVATAGEIVALLTFEVQISGKHFGLFSLCFPYPVLETVLGHLSTQHIFQTKGLVASNDERMKMISKINSSTVDVRVQFGTCSITLDDFLQLAEGDIIKLDNKVEDDLIFDRANFIIALQTDHETELYNWINDVKNNENGEYSDYRYRITVV